MYLIVWLVLVTAGLGTKLLDPETEAPAPLGPVLEDCRAPPFDEDNEECPPGGPPDDHIRGDLPPVLEFLDGTQVTNMQDWERRKEEMKDLLQSYLIGRFPTEAPSLVTVETLSSNEENGVLSSFLRLTFDTSNRASFVIELMIPTGLEPPYPLFLTQTNHRRWALNAIHRGYAACVYPGADLDDQSHVFQDAFPDLNWGRLSRRAYVAMRALDYLLQLPIINREQVAITGHSRNGKESIIAAAFDERITAVVSSSSGVPVTVGWRISTAEYVSERARNYLNWFIPNATCWIGYENRLPIDGHNLIALIAPRPVLVYVGHQDAGENVWGIEHSYRVIQKAYQFLGASDNLRIKYRFGVHHGFIRSDTFFDWYDLKFGRARIRPSAFPEDLLLDFDWNEWNKTQTDHTIPTPTTSARERIMWGLGVIPPGPVALPAEPGGFYDEWNTAPYVGLMMDHDNSRGTEGVLRRSIGFGQSVSANLYYPENSVEPLPAVIWLHPFSYSQGYKESQYPRDSTTIYHALAAEGFLVFAFDFLGFGTRTEDRKLFYDEYPEWSVLGHIIRDVQYALQVLRNQEGPYHSGDCMDFPLVDRDNIYVAGFSLGGNVALHLAALYPEGIAGVASISGFTPFRTDTDTSPTGGIRRWWSWHALQPRLGWLHGRESEIPYDYDDILREIVPLPLLIFVRTQETSSNLGDVRRVVEEAQSTNPNPNLTFIVDEGILELDDEVHEILFGWLHERTKSH